MMIPPEVGLSPIGDVTYAERVKNLLVRLQGEGGYGDAEDSARVLELLSMAYALGVTYGTLDAVGDNAFPHLAVELLEEHETARRIPNDAPRTIAERQLRAAVIDAAVRGGGAAGIEAALARLGVTATMVSTSRAQIQLEGSEDDGILQTLVQVSAADWTLARRTLVADFLRRFLPALQLGQMQHISPSEAIVTSIDTVWAPGEDVRLGQIAIGEGTAFTQQREPSRLKSYARTSRLTARDLNAIQDATVIAAASGADNDLSVQVDGARFYSFAVEIDPAATKTLLTGIDARDRLVRVFCRYSTDDIRPGEADDELLNLADYYEKLWWTGTGGVPYQIGSSGVGTFSASSTQITLRNDGIATRRIVGFLELSGQVTGGTQSQAVTTFDEVSDLSDLLTPTWWTTFRDAIAMRPATGAVDTWSGFTGAGGLHRLAVIGHSVKPGAGSTSYVLDASEDWRDRLILVQCVMIVSSFVDGAQFPGAPLDHYFSTLGPTVGSRVVYGGTAAAEIEGGARISVRTSDGALLLIHTSAYGGDDHLTAIVMVRATDQLGASSAAVPLTPPPTPGSGAVIEPSQLNWIQDIAMMTQGRGLPASIGVTGIDCDAMPLGPVTSGSPPIPRAWRVRRRDGIANTDRVERRQNVAGSLRRVFACDVTSPADVVLDDAHDWRDRFAHGSCAYYAPDDIRPGAATDTHINDGTATQTLIASYLGPGRASGGAILAAQHYIPVNGNVIGIYARSTDGALCLRASGGGPLTIVGWIDASFPLGPRSV